MRTHTDVSFARGRMVSVLEFLGLDADPRHDARARAGESVAVVGRVAAYDPRTQLMTLEDPDDPALEVEVRGEAPAPPTSRRVVVSLVNFRDQFLGGLGVLVQFVGEVDARARLVARVGTRLDDDDYPELRREMLERRAWFAEVHGSDVVV